MKMAKRVLAIIVTVLMIVSTCAVAASATGSIQAQINSGSTTITLTADTRESITVDRDITIDLGGHTLRGNYGESAITVTAGNVTITNGRVYSYFEQGTSVNLIKNVFKKSPSAIKATGGNVVIDGVRVVGSFARVPTTNSYILPTGSAVQLTGGATATLRRASLFGDYGVNNAVTGATAGGAVTIEDAIIVAYNQVVKGAENVAPGTEKVNAADRIEGFLNNGVSLNAKERQLVRDMFDQRAYVYTKTVPEDQVATVTVTEGEDFATVTAPTFDYTWGNTTSTDCSYKLVPVGVLLTDGTYAPLDAVDAAKVPEEATQIRYRVDFKMCNDVKRYVDDIDNYIDLEWWANYIEEGYDFWMDNGTKDVDSYQEILEAIGDVLATLDSIALEPIPFTEEVVEDQPEFINLRKKIIEIGGKAAYDASSSRITKFGPNQYKYYFGDDATVPSDGIYGTMDRVEKILYGTADQNRKGGLAQYRPFTNTANWGDAVVYLYDNYEEIIDGAKTLLNQIKSLSILLKGDMYQTLLGMCGDDVKEAVKLIDLVGDNAQTALNAINDVLDNADVKATLNAIEDNKADLKYYVNKAVDVVGNYETYVTPANFIDGAFVKTYSTFGDANVEYVKAPKKLEVRIDGTGYVEVSVDGKAAADARNDKQTYDFEETFTLTAHADVEEQFEFVYWVNFETNRILGTEPTLTVNSSISRSIEAVFAAVDEPIYTFVNVTGGIQGYGEADANGNIVFGSDVMNPVIPGFAFKNWTGANGGMILATAIADANLTAYYSGNSAFAANNAYYGKEGAILSAHDGATSLLILPVYDNDGVEYAVEFVDGNKKYTTKGPYGNITDAVTAEGDNFAYWADENDNKVCLTPTYEYTIVREAKFHAVYNDVTPDASTFISGHTVKEGKVSFFAERAVSAAYDGKILSAGIVGSYSNPMPTIGGENVFKGTAKFTSNNGVYIPSVKLEKITNYVYIRPFIEVEGLGTIYGDPYTYPQ